MDFENHCDKEDTLANFAVIEWMKIEEIGSIELYDSQTNVSIFLHVCEEQSFQR